MALASNTDGDSSFDAELPVVEAIAEGDRYAFEEFVGRHACWVRAVIYAVLGDRDRVDDVSQQVWINVWDQAKRLRDPSRWRSWLYRMARNAAVDAGRSDTRRKKISGAVLSDAIGDGPSGQDGEDLERSEQRAAVLGAIRSLPTLYREPLVLRHMQGWSYQQISDVMGMPVDTVETRLVRARRLLREALEGRV